MFGLDAVLDRLIPREQPPFAPGVPPRPRPPVAAHDEVLAQRLIGALAMVVVATVAWWCHRRVSLDDRRRVAIGGEAAAIRRVYAYLIVAIALVLMTSAAIQLLSAVWIAIVDAPTGGPPRFSDRRPPSAEQRLTWTFIGTAPILLLAPILWLAHWIPAARLAAGGGAESDAERRSRIRKATLYVITFVAALAVLLSLSLVLTDVVRSLIGGDGGGDIRVRLTMAAFPLSALAVLAPIWLFHRRAIVADTARQPELESQADMRRQYFSVIAVIALGMIAFGTAGLIGALGSQLMGYFTHQPEEIARYIALIVVGVPAWWYHWSQNQRYARSPDERIARAERESRLRRAHLFLVIAGSAIVVLVAGSAALFRMLNALLGGGLDLMAIHDIWHQLVNTSVGATSAFLHWRVLRADRVGEAPAVTAAATPVATRHAFVVSVEGADAASARAALEAALGQTGRVEGQAG